MASRGEARTDTTAGDVLAPAWSLRWRAPEVALLFAERAGAVAKLAGDGPDRLRAEATVVVASCRVGQRLAVVERAIDAVRLAERQSDNAIAAMLRVELAGCARTAGVPLVGAAVLRPVLAMDSLQPSVRADALMQMVGCLGQLADPGVLDEALADADRLYAEDRDLDPDSRVVFRALLRSVVSGEQRRRGDARAAVHAAQEGAALLASLNEPSADNGEVGARVALRLVHGLLDLGRVDEATAVATAELAAPVRAPAANAIGWLALAMAVRKHLAAGAPRAALALLREAADLAERHRLSSLRAEALTTLSDAHERIGQLAEALDCLRTAQGVRLRRARSAYAARTKLVAAFGETTSPEEFVRLLGGPSGRRSASGRADGSGREQAAALLGRFGMRHPIGTAVAGSTRAAGSISAVSSSAVPNTDVTMVLVDLTTPGASAATGLIGEQVVSQVLDRVRDAAPTDAQVARVGGAELAVLLPSTRIGQTERWVEQLRGAIAKVDWTSFTPGLAVSVRVAVAQQSGRRAAQPVQVTAAEALLSAQDSQSAQPVQSLQAAQAMQSAQALQAAQAMAPAQALQSAQAMQSAQVIQSAQAVRSVQALRPAQESQSAQAVSSAQAASSVQAVQSAQPAAGGAAPMSVFDLPTVPLLPLGIGFGQPAPDTVVSGSDSSAGTGGADDEDVVAKALAQWRQLRAAQVAESADPSGSGSRGGHSSEVTKPRIPKLPQAAPVRDQSGVAAVERSSGRLPIVPAPSAWTPAPPLPQRQGGHRSDQQPADQRPYGAHTQPGAPQSAAPQVNTPPQPAAPPPILPALPIPPPLEPAAPDSTSALFQSARSGHESPDQFPLSSDPSVRISAADISAAGTPEPEQPSVQPTADEIDAALRADLATLAEFAAAADTPPTGTAPASELDMWAPGPPPSEPPMSWPADTADTASTDQSQPDDPYRSPFADSPFADPMGDPNEPSRPRHGVDADAGRSVLSSLGITSGSTPSPGGRRRAKEDEPERHPEPEPDRPASTEPPTPPPPGMTDQRSSERTSGSLVPRTVSFDDFGHLEPLPPSGPTPERTPWQSQRPHVAQPPMPTAPNPIRPAAQVSAESDTERMERLRHGSTAEPPQPPAIDAKTAEPAVAQPKQDNPPARTGRRRRSVQLADLLTEALMAYQTVQDTNDARTNPLSTDPSSSLPGPTSLPGPLAGPVGLDPAVGDEPGYPGPARHRGDNQFGDSRWHTTRWDPTEERP